MTDDPTSHLRTLAARVVDAALALGPLRGALLAGSAARGDADYWSDLDLLLYVDELPPPERPEELREALGGVHPVRFGDRTESFDAIQFEVGGVAVQVSYGTVTAVDAGLERLVDRLEAVDSPSQKILVGLAEGVALRGEELVASWQSRVADYPEAFRRAAVERHWRFFPLWYHAEQMAHRDGELWRLDVLLDAAFDLLAVLAALNRLWFARFELKRMHAFARRMELAPPRVVERLESLFRLPPIDAADELGRLVLETRELVARELPDLELPLRQPPGTTRARWGP